MNARDSSIRLSELLRRDAELGLLTYRPSQPGLTSVPVARDDMALLVARGHPLARRSEVSIRELGGESFLAHNVRSPYRERVLQSFARCRTPLNIVIELPSLDAIKRLVEQGLGIALMPRRVAQAELARGELAALIVREMPYLLAPCRRGWCLTGQISRQHLRRRLHQLHPGIVQRNRHSPRSGGDPTRVASRRPAGRCRHVAGPA